MYFELSKMGYHSITLDVKNPGIIFVIFFLQNLNFSLAEERKTIYLGLSK